MTRMLLVWEQGHNLGHLSRLAAVAGLLKQRGVEVTWAVPPHRQVALGVRGCQSHDGDPCLAAPWLQTAAVPQRRPGRLESYADVLTTFGFLDHHALQQVVKAWLACFEQLGGVDGLVLDYAPTAQLAAWIVGLPAVQITNGFDGPPPGCPLFALGPRRPMLERRNAEQVRSLDRSIGGAARACGAGGEATLSDVLTYPQRWYDCIPETDPYGPRSDGVYLGPIGKLRQTAQAAWPAAPSQSPKVFAYLRDEKQVAAVSGMLDAAGASALVAWPGATAADAARYCTERVQVVTEPVTLTTVLPEAHAVVNYGSSTLICQALLAGKPQLMLPTDVEKWLIAQRVKRLGAGLVNAAIPLTLDPKGMRALLSPKMVTRAREIASRYSGIERLLPDAVDRWVESVVRPERSRMEHVGR
jgi:hypothetical protein